MKHMLLIFAHPSDESFICAATVAKYVKAGWTVDLLCATLGEKENGDEGEIHKKELESAGELLGIASVTFLGYKNGSLQADPPGELEEILYSKMTEIIPDVVITYDTTGVNNNPDNVRLSYSATYAFQKYALWIEDRMKEQTEYTDSDAPKLYYACLPESSVGFLKRKQIFPTESFGKPLNGIADKRITSVIRTEGAQMAKKKALRMFQSMEPEFDAFLAFKSNPFLKQEYFIQRFSGTSEVFMGKNDRVSSKL